MIKLENVGKIYSTNNNVSVGIRKVNLELNVGEFVAITGESGSGKSTLLNVISGIDSYEEGEMYINGEETSYYSIEDMEEYRNKYVGFIFQNYNIIDSYTVLENVTAALLFTCNGTKEQINEKAIELISRVGLKDKINDKASKLSGGEKQRVVIARALAKDPLIIAADEPTGNLDSKSSKEIIELLHEISKDKLVLVVTHDFEELEAYATRMIRVFDGEIKEDRKLQEVEANKIDEHEINSRKPISLKKTIPLGLKDMFSSPKRMIFQTIVFTILSFFILLLIGVYRLVLMPEVNDSYYFSPFSNSDTSRIVAKKADGTYFTDADFNTIKDIKNVDEIQTNDLLVDRYLYTWDDSYSNEIAGYIKNASTLKASDLTNGRLPESEYEFVYLYTDKLDQNILDTSFSFDKYSENPLNLKCVGTIDATSSYEGSKSYIYLSDSYYQKLSINSYLKNFNANSYPLDVIASCEDSEGNNIRQNLYFIVYSSSLNDTQFAIEYPDSIFAGSKKVTIQISDMYREIATFSNFECLTMEDKSLIDDPDIDDAYYYYSTIILSKNNYDILVNEVKNSYQISIFASSPKDAEQIVKELAKKGYKAVIPTSISENDFSLTMILSILSLVGIAFNLVEACGLVYVTLLHSVKSRRDDVEILRTIGASKKEVKRMFSVELIFTGIIAFSVVTITFICLRYFTHGNFSLILAQLGILDFIILFVLVCLLSYLLSLLFSFSLFKKTVRKSLDQR